ncbi:endonuclease VII domain-containing protein [Streptomyces albus]|uniref:endonuclease VII domain-containing protein n=1 Tax=Streptomyces sp. NRRL F-5639 TaxID=1463867 RepID=UPI000998C3B9|nr:endonuclease VII domain-containing protein [Streptomyces sp. NRRL F-5639]
MQTIKGTAKCACCGGMNERRFVVSGNETVWAFICDSPKCNEDQQEIAKRVRKYGLSYDQYAEIHQYQRGKCPICAEPIGKFRPGIVIDHDHSCCPGRKSCGRCVRGILHHQCNIALGMLRDDPDNAERAADYLREEFPWQ